MSDLRALERECEVFARYLVGRPPSAYVRRNYLAGHDAGVLDRAERGVLDAVLVRVAAGGPTAARVADAYARVFDRGAVLRRKLVLLLAILESSPPTHAEFVPAGAVGRLRVLSRLAGAVAGFLAALGAGALVFLPIHVALGLREALRRARRSGTNVARVGVS
jgi:hypothetical protein